MLKLLLADDDILTLNKLHHILDSKVSEFVVIGQSLDGVDALQKIREFLPDLIILDMEMPKANGIEVAKAILKENMKTKILALSNYDNFEYVKPIMQLGALDYILKHELSAKLLLTKLQQIQKLIIRQEQNTKHFRYLSAMAKQSILHKLLVDDKEDLFPEEFIEQQKEFSGKRNILICIQIINFIILYNNDPDHAHKKTIQSILDIFSNVLTTLENGVTTYMEDGEFLVLLNADKYISLKERGDYVNNVIQLLRNNLSKTLNIHIFTQVIYCTDGLSQLRNYYLKAHNELYQKPFAKNNKKLTQSTSYGLALTDEKSLVDALYMLDKRCCTEVIANVFEQLSTENASSNEIEGVVVQLLNILSRFLESYKYVDVPKKNLIEEWFKAGYTVETLKDNLTEFYTNALNSIAKQSSKSHSAIIHSALNYIAEYYHKDISLQVVAAHCNISEVYLSKLFKSEMKISFVNYLNNHRIEIAKGLLENSDKAIKNIYEDVGFRNYNYFIKVFKDITGMTPMGFKKKVSKNAIDT